MESQAPAKHQVGFMSQKNVLKYKPLFKGLYDQFENEHWETILTYCGIIEADPDDFGKYWQLWVIDVKDRTVGMCGLYSLQKNDNSELWLDWFGVLPQYRKLGIGSDAILYMEHEARNLGCKKIMTYVDNDEVLKFYKKNGFEYCGTVHQFVSQYVELRHHLGEPDNIVIAKEII